MKKRRLYPKPFDLSKLNEKSNLSLPSVVQKGEIRVAYKNGSKGTMYQGWLEDFAASPQGKRYRGKVSLIFTSPPFPLNRKKKYGNFKGEEYTKWLASVAPSLTQFLTSDGSIVIEMGNAWTPGKPVMDTLAMRSLLEFLDQGNLYLCEQFVCYNNARLPSPAQWVNIERIRVKDAFTHVWWMSPTTKPKADNRRILKPYSQSMKDIIRTGKYNGGRRPSEYRIGKTSFATDNKGAIRSNVIEFSNTVSVDAYQSYCRRKKLVPHPARMHKDVADYFINFLTLPGDIVLDPFAGSNTTGAVAQDLGRKWISIEPRGDYIQGSLGRFI